MIRIHAAFLALFALIATTPYAECKQKLDEFLKPKSIERLKDYDVVVNSEWAGEKSEDFQFINAMQVRAPIKHSYDTVTDYELYPKMSSAIKKAHLDPGKKIIEFIGEAAGYFCHSWIKVDDSKNDELDYEFVEGGLKGFKVHTTLYEDGPRTILVMKGYLPKGKSMVPSALSLIMKPVSELVLSVAAKNMRGHIEDEYEKKKNKK